MYSNSIRGVERLMDTKKLLEELKNCDDFKKFYKTHRDSVERKNLSDYLAELIKKRY